jgi:hypothetical protein
LKSRAAWLQRSVRLREMRRLVRNEGSGCRYGRVGAVRFRKPMGFDSPRQRLKLPMPGSAPVLSLFSPWVLMCSRYSLEASGWGFESL